MFVLYHAAFRPLRIICYSSFSYHDKSNLQKVQWGDFEKRCLSLEAYIG